MQGCTTTGYIGILRAAPPRKSAAEKTPATPFPREEMAWTAMAAIHIVARILRTNVDHLNPARRLAEPFSTAMLRSNLESYPPAALLLMNPSAHPKQSAKGVLSLGSGAHDRQRSGVIPAQPSQTIGLSRENSHHLTFFTCYPILFWEKLFARGFGRCSRVEYAAK